MTPLLGLLLIGLVAWFWFDSLRAREIANGLCDEVCRRQNAQFLNGTVGLSRLGLRRDADGRLRIRRVYGFEYSHTGAERRHGTVILLGTRLETFLLEERDLP